MSLMNDIAFACAVIAACVFTGCSVVLFFEIKKIREESK